MDHSARIRPEAVMFARDETCHGSFGLVNLASRQALGQRTLFEDPAQVQHWAAISATGPMPITNGSSLRPARHNEDVCNDVSGCVSLGHYSSLPEVSASLLSLPYDDNVPGMLHSTYHGTGSNAFENPAFSPKQESCNQFAMDPSFSEDSIAAEEQLHYDTWMKSDTSFDWPGSLDADPLESRSYRFDPEEAHCQRLWMEAGISNLEDISNNAEVYTRDQTSWSSPSTESMEPSLSSSLSQGNLFSKYVGSPSTLSIHEDLNSTGSNEECILSPLSIGGPAQVFFGHGSIDMQYDASSTLRATQGFQRPSVPNMAWPPSDSNAQGTSSGDMYLYRRPSLDGENANARNNELYHVGPQEDGLYHCPFIATESCTHKADKLKCNYDKHLDSHLKPYRCKDRACANVPFSSTACLLRHEREAHGMHGHGDKPYMCSYEDCDRSRPGFGFPRRWNLQDHMRRVHDHTRPVTSDDNSIMIQDVPEPKPRKKRNSVNSQASTKRSKTGTITKATSRAMASQKPNLSIQKQWEEQYASLQEGMSMLDPTDAQAHELPTADIAALNHTGNNFRQLECFS